MPIELQILVCNTNEDVLPMIEGMKNPDAEKKENNVLGERGLFYLLNKSGQTIIISPLEISPAFITYVKGLFPEASFSTSYPKDLGIYAGELSLAILNDPMLLKELESLMVTADQIVLEAYCASPQLYDLYEGLSKLTKKRISLGVPEKNNWPIVNSIGTKSGLRQLWQDGAFGLDIEMPNGEIVRKTTPRHLDFAAKKAAIRYQEHQGVVVKTEKGHAGEGVLLYEPGSLKGLEHENGEKILKDLLAQAYWENFDVVIEDFVLTDIKAKGSGGGLPNAEFNVDENTVEFLYSCGMRVDKDGHFQGVEIGPNVLDPEIEHKLKIIGSRVGRVLQEGGYRGRFEVDCIYGENKTLYLSESNVRRNGGTHVHEAARALVGDHYMDTHYLVSNSLYKIKGENGWNFENLLKTLASVLYNKETETGLVITTIASLDQNIFGYFIVGKNKEETYAIEAEMEQRLMKAH